MSEQPLYKVGTIARLLNVSERRVQQLAKDGIIPKPSHGKYDLIPCVQAYIKYLQNCLNTGHHTIDSQLERARFLRAKADKTEMEVGSLKGTLIPADTIEKIWCAMLAAFRAKMLALPSKATQLIAPCKDSHEIREVLTSQVHEALSELAQYEPERFIPTDTQVPDGTQTAAEADGKPMGGQTPETKLGSKRRTRKVAH